MRRRIIRLIGMLGILCSASYPASVWAIETMRPNCSLESIEKTKAQSKDAGRWIEVSLQVVVPGEFDKMSVHKIIYGTTPAELLKIDYEVGNGVVCCRPDDVKSVNGLDTDFTQNKYWTVAVNDSMKVSPNNTILEEGDLVEWRYHEDAGFPKALLNSDKWR